MRNAAFVLMLPWLIWPSAAIAQGETRLVQERVAYLQVPKPGGGVDRLCFVYHPGGAGRSVISFPIEPAMSPDGHPYYAHFDYEVSPDLTTLTARHFFALRQTRPGPAGVITARLYEQPQPGWPCPPQNWARLGFDRQISVGNETQQRQQAQATTGTAPPQNFPHQSAGDRPTPGIPAPQAPVAQDRGGDMAYTFVELPVLDSHFNPIPDATGHPRIETYCLLWKPSWMLDRVNVFVLSENAKFYDAITYHVDQADLALVLDKLAAPTTVYEGGKLQDYGGTTVYRANVKVRLFPKPQSDWPCSDKDWNSTLDHLQVLAINPPPAMPGPILAPTRGKPTVPHRPDCVPSPSTMGGMYCPYGVH